MIISLILEEGVKFSSSQSAVFIFKNLFSNWNKQNTIDKVRYLVNEGDKEQEFMLSLIKELHPNITLTPFKTSRNNNLVKNANHVLFISSKDLPDSEFYTYATNNNISVINLKVVNGFSLIK